MWISMISYSDIVGVKEEIKRTIARELTLNEMKGAGEDPHARRKPRPCGLTVHTGIGCSLRCLYCYIEDMGFKWGIEPYPLTGKQLVYALASNKYFIPGPSGTFIAIGSVTEPFLPETRSKAFEYIEAISRYLGNPIQFSTKMRISREEALRLRKIEPGISPLITIITLSYASKLEPYAPPPEERFKTIRNLASAGLKPVLFYRPIIPGIAEQEYRELLKKARYSGAVGVVAGSLRITKLILSRLGSVGIDVNPIIRRAPRIPQGREQIAIDVSDIKREVLEYASKIGLIPFPQACMANLYSHGGVCWRMMELGIVKESPPPIDYSAVKTLAKELGVALKGRPLYRRGTLFVRVYGKKDNVEVFMETIKYLFKVCVRKARSR